MQALDFEALDQAIAVIESMVRDFEPGVLDARGSVRAVEGFVKVTHLGEAGTALAAKRADETHAHRGSGCRTAAEWLARKRGVPVTSAERALATVDALGELPVTEAAFRAGRISEVQAHEITAAARKDPSAEALLVSEAKAGISMKGLKDRCRRVHALAEADDAAWAARLERSRSLRTWVDGDSAPCGMWRMAPDKGAETNAALDAEIDLLFKEARAAGCDAPSREAIAADALHALVTRGPRKPTGITLVMDAEVTEQGYAKPGQRCEIPGIGPIPVTLARRMLAGASVRALPSDPALLPEYESSERKYPAWMLDWLKVRYPVCGQPGCDRDAHLQNDHVVALADGGTTTIWNLWRLCWYHHDLKTNHGWTVTGEPHNWKLVPPDGRDPP
jgi:HNH endonuclease